MGERNASAALQRKSVRRATVDLLEPRRMLSGNVPDGYVLLGSSSISSMNSVATLQSVDGGEFMAKAGTTYRLVGSGVMTLSTNDGRQVDSEMAQIQGAPST